MDTAFKEDGVERMGELLSFFQAGVLGLSDGKLLQVGQLYMHQTLKLRKAAEYLLEEHANRSGLAPGANSTPTWTPLRRC